MIVLFCNNYCHLARRFCIEVEFQARRFWWTNLAKKICCLFAAGDALLSCRISKGCIRCDVKIVLIVTTFDKARYLYICFPYCYVESTSKLISHLISANITCWTWLGSVIKCSNMMMCSLFPECVARVPVSLWGSGG